MYLLVCLFIRLVFSGHVNRLLMLITGGKIYNVIIFFSKMLIELENQVVIFDEAHNMEDAAREAASFSVTSSQLVDVEKELDEICKGIIRGREGERERESERAVQTDRGKKE